MGDSNGSNASQIAQTALAELNSAVYAVLVQNPEGLRNVDIDKALGIYAGHEGHEGHIPRTLLALMGMEGVVTKSEKNPLLWVIKKHGERSGDD